MKELQHTLVVTEKEKQHLKMANTDLADMYDEKCAELAAITKRR